MSETSSGLWYPGDGWEEKLPKAYPTTSPFKEESDTPVSDTDGLIDEFRQELDDYGT